MNRLAEHKEISNQLAELFIQLAEFMHIFNRLDELFIPLVEFILIFKLLVESTRRTRRVHSVPQHAEDFRVMQGLQTVDLLFPNLSPT